MLMLPELGHGDDRDADCNDSYNQWLVTEFGPDPNIANVSFDTVLDLEATRNGSRDFLRSSPDPEDQRETTTVVPTETRW